MQKHEYSLFLLQSVNNSNEHRYDCSHLTLSWSVMCQLQEAPIKYKYIFHKNREISILTMKKKQQGASSGSHKKNQTRGDKKQNEKRKTCTGMNKSASLTPVPGPSTVVCMIVT
jgi:hypothetical protein